MNGKQTRLRRILGKDRRCVMIPLDHGLSMGPKSLENMEELMKQIEKGNGDAVVLHKGHAQKAPPGLAVLVMLNGTTALSQDPRCRSMIGSVKHANAIGADGVSIQVNLGADNEREMLHDLGFAAEEAYEYGMPLLAMMYPRGPKVKDEEKAENVLKCARVAEELGADIVKVMWPGSKEAFANVTSSVKIPVLLAGGAKTNDPKDTLALVHESIQAGGSGVSLGRNVFEYKNPSAMTKALAGIIHKNWSVEEALEELKE